MPTSLTPRRRLLAALVALVLLAGGAAGAVAGDALGQDTSAVAVNTTDNSSVFRLAFSVKRVASDTVTNQNAAVAYASCTSCQTVAISIQILLITGQPSVFAPENVAIAINQNCTLCDTMAAAYQFAVGIGTKLKFTPDGRKALNDIRKQLKDLKNSGLTGPAIAARVDGLMKQLSQVLSTQLIGVEEPARPPDAGGGPEAAAPDAAAPADTAPADTTSTPAGTAPESPATTSTPTSTAPSGTSTTPADTTTPTTTTPADTTATTP